MSKEDLIELQGIVVEVLAGGNYKIKISENRQYRIGLVSFSGNTKTQDKVIRRELFTLPGQYFNRGALPFSTPDRGNRH